ncbi:hypothetical protein NHX12_004082 [Muraenolepis orangiensis]|uniref:RETREG1-3/ARL6IP-like N-terminal reticulon-homology domain-containing protein n=1 Tax=Muraenolepis orangiensis TaxID=630683 RepID=A0A9Q0IDU9_9TELE|nr:hypothetical protein NHX12_004082 [Muraenolepis orangiensis]
MTSRERTERMAGGEDDAAAAAAAAGPGDRAGGEPVEPVEEVEEVPGPLAAGSRAAPRRTWSPAGWRRAARTAARFAAANGAFWCVALSTCRAYCLVALSLAAAVAVATLREAVAMSGTREKHLRIGAWNVRTLTDNQASDRPERRTAIISRELRKFQIDIAALSETRRKEEKGGYTFFWKGKPANEPRIHGVGFAIKNCLINHLHELPVGTNA